MYRILLLIILALHTGLPRAFAAPINPSDIPTSMPLLEQRLKEIDNQLSKLAQFSLRGGIGAIAYRSMWHKEPDHVEWVQIDFEREVPIDEIVMIPVLWRDSANGFQSDSFPAAFQIFTGTKGDTNGTLLCEFDADDGILPRIAPFLIPVMGTHASWIRIVATQLSPRGFDNYYVFQLSEILVLIEKPTWLCIARSPPPHNTQKEAARGTNRT